MHQRKQVSALPLEDGVGISADIRSPPAQVMKLYLTCRLTSWVLREMTRSAACIARARQVVQRVIKLALVGSTPGRRLIKLIGCVGTRQHQNYLRRDLFSVTRWPG